MDEPKIAGAPAGHQPPEPTVEAPTAAPAAQVMPAVEMTAPTPARPRSAPPVATAEPAPEPPAPSPAVERADADDLSSKLREELEAAQAAREALEAREARASAKERLAYLRQMGALVSLSDDHLLRLAPEVDPGTQDGREALHAWTESNGGLFVQRTPVGVEAQRSVLERLPSSAEGVFGPALHQRVINSVFGSGSDR